MLQPACLTSILRAGFISSHSQSHSPRNKAQDQHEVFSYGSPDYLVTSILVSSYAQVGWIPIEASSYCFVIPILTATAYPCITSPALGPA